MICPRVHSRSVAAVGNESGSGAPSPDCTAPMALQLAAAHGTDPFGYLRAPELGWGNPFPLAFFALISRFWEHLRRKTRRTHLTLSWVSGLSPGQFLQERFWGP